MSEKRIFDRLVQAGMTKQCAAAMLGNIWAESSCEAVRVQGDNKSGRAESKNYAQRVDSGAISRYDFGHDEKGWGLIQWTFWSRKFGLYDYAVSRGVSIGDEDMQVDYILTELKRDAAGLWSFLCTSEERNLASDRICREFERPAVNNYDDRRTFAANVYLRCAYADPEPEPETEKKSEFWPPRMIDKGMEGLDVGVLQSILIAMKPIEWALNVNDIFDDRTEQVLKLCQEELGLTPDGVAGKQTWTALGRELAKRSY